MSKLFTFNEYVERAILNGASISDTVVVKSDLINGFRFAVVLEQKNFDNENIANLSNVIDFQICHIDVLCKDSGEYQIELYSGFAQFCGVYVNLYEVGSAELVESWTINNDISVLRHVTIAIAEFINNY